MDEDPLEQASSEFREEAMLAAIAERLMAGDGQGAIEAATRVIAVPSGAFRGPAHERFVRARAHELRAQAAVHEETGEAALLDYRTAADLGSAAAAHQLAGRLVVLASMAIAAGDHGARVDAWLAEAERYHRVAAELGVSEAMDILAHTLGLRGETVEQCYWSLVRRMSDPPEMLARAPALFQQSLSDADRAVFARALAEYGLSGAPGSMRAPGGDTEPALPGRSTLTSAFVELSMRRQLGFVWRASFDPGRGEEDRGVLESYRALRGIVAAVAFVDLYLLVGGVVTTDDPRIVSVAQRSLGAGLLPGDQVVAHADAREHMATLWSIDRGRDAALLLDPFPEFWQPAHNSAIESCSVVPYRHQRSLVSLSLTELEQTLVAVMTIRDRAREP